MVIRYFGNKESLFAQAVEVDLRLPNLTDVQPDQLAQVLLPHFFRIWESDSTFLALLRASATNPEAAATLQGLFVTQTGPVLQTAALDHPAQRAAMLGAFVFGVGMTRNILKATVLNEMTQVELERWLGSLIHWALRDPDVVKDLN